MEKTKTVKPKKHKSTNKNFADRVQRALSNAITAATHEFGTGPFSPKWPGIEVVRKSARDAFIEALTFYCSGQDRTRAGETCTCPVQIDMLIDQVDISIFENKQVFNDVMGINQNNYSEAIWSITKRLYRPKGELTSPGVNMGCELLGIAHMATLAFRKVGEPTERHTVLIRKKLENILFPGQKGVLVTPNF